MDKDSMGTMIDRGIIVKSVIEKRMSQKSAAIRLKLSVRQIRRLCKKYKAEGAKSLIHGNKNKPSKRKIAEEKVLKAIEWLKTNGPDYGPTFASEKILQYCEIKLSRSTTRRIMLQYGLIKEPKKKEKKEFKRRQRKECFGAMLQIDGSFDKWIGDDKSTVVLLTVVDDATGKIESLLADGESTEALMALMRTYIEKYGIPQVVYSDHGSAYKVNVGNHEGIKQTQLGRALAELGIDLIFANSPQAKGRIERNHAIHQDRLIKELRLRKISTMEAANAYLQEEYIPEFNRRFTVVPTRAEDVHRSAKGFDMDRIFSVHHTRKIQNDGIIQFNNMLFQITKNRSYAQPKSDVTIRVHLDHSLTLWSGTTMLGYEVIDERPVHEQQVKPVSNNVAKPNEASKAWKNGNYLMYMAALRRQKQPQEGE